MLEFKELEDRILKFWEDNDVFQKSMESRKGKKAFVFFEGPPTANGNPGIHHVIARVFKDVFNRYKTMSGYYVLRKGGWDTHGLPVELQVEKELGFKSKKDIEAYGVAAYNKKCRESVWKYKTEWEKFTKRIAYWVDLQHPYVTYETPYIESLWSVIGKIWDRDLLYQAHRVVPFCTRCGTPLSSHEVAQGYKTVTDTSVYLKFKITKAPAKLKLPKNTSILAWTTTPWTLPGNVALAVGRNIQYVLARKGEEYFILAADLANKVLGAPLAIEAEFTGANLIGIQYAPLFPVKSLKKPSSYKVYEADFVTTTDGTGVVHTAVMYGEDDYKLGDKLKLVKQHTVTEQGTFFGVSAELDGRYVKSATTENMILEQLESRGLLLARVPYEHEYPFCWRCDTPLLYYAKDSWFIHMSSLNKQLIENNENINWAPDHLKHGRFGQWIKEAKDWAFSRERYWATPLPIWMSRDKHGLPTGEPLVVSSMADLEKYRADKPATFWVMRHGESEKNVQNIIDSGGSTSHLTELGKKQVVESAKALKAKLAKKKIKIAAIVASPINRAAETAEIVAAEFGIKSVQKDERLEEIHLGPTLEGCHDSAYDERYPKYEDRFNQKPEAGESLTDLRRRMWGALSELNKKYAGKDVLLVSHEYPMWMMTDAANGWSMDESIAEKIKRGDDFVGFAEVLEIKIKNLPRDEHGIVDLHRPYIDEIELKRPNSKVVLKRIPDVCDVWFDSGAMPYAQWHWPFENDAMFKEQFPADFISEAIDQTRGWFYTLLAVSTAIGMGAPFKNVLSIGHVLDEKGQKMSKSKGNVVLPNDVFDAVGVDAARWYFYTVNSPGDTKNFSMKDVRERLTGFIMTLQNCLRFYDLYRSEHPQTMDESTPENQLDQWLLSRLNGVVDVVTKSLNKYDPTTAARAIDDFVVDDFSQWWLRRSRKRVGALGLLRATLRVIALLIAPFVPYTAEDLWQKLREDGDALSVHLADWPKFHAAAVKPELETQMLQAREFISAGLAIRKEEGIKVRQPLASVAVSSKKFSDDLESLIMEELNVKSVIYTAGAAVALDTKVGEELRAEGWAREVMRAVQDMRKELGCKVSDLINCNWHSEDAEITNALQAHAAMITKDTNLSFFENRHDERALSIERTFELAAGKSLWLGIWK